MLRHSLEGQVFFTDPALMRISADDPTNKFMKDVQICQNKMLRMLDRVSLKEHVTNKSLLAKYNLASVNQLAAEIKLLEAWKAINVTNYPFQMEKNNPDRIDTGREIRTTSIKEWKDDYKTKAASENVSRDTARLWNNAPTVIKMALSLRKAKSEIKKYVKTLEI